MLRLKRNKDLKFNFMNLLHFHGLNFSIRLDIMITLSRHTILMREFNSLLRLSGMNACLILIKIQKHELVNNINKIAFPK